VPSATGSDGARIGPAEALFTAQRASKTQKPFLGTSVDWPTSPRKRREAARSAGSQLKTDGAGFDP